MSSSSPSFCFFFPDLDISFLEIEALGFHKIWLWPCSIFLPGDFQLCHHLLPKSPDPTCSSVSSMKHWLILCFLKVMCNQRWRVCKKKFVYKNRPMCMWWKICFCVFKIQCFITELKAIIDCSFVTIISSTIINQIYTLNCQSFFLARALKRQILRSWHCQSRPIVPVSSSETFFS